MNSFEINKIIASILLVVLLVVSVNKLGDIVFEVEKPKMAAYKVEGLVATTKSTTNSNTAEAVDVSALLALGSVEKGKKVFKKCAACHSKMQVVETKLDQNFGM